VYQRFGYLTVAHPILVARGRVKPFENSNGLILQVQQVSPPQFVAGPAKPAGPAASSTRDRTADARSVFSEPRP